MVALLLLHKRDLKIRGLGARTATGVVGKTRSSPVVHAKNKILKIKQFSLGTATAIFLSQTNMSTFKDARTVLLESYLDGVIDDDKFILLCDETLKKPKFPYEFFFIFT